MSIRAIGKRNDTGFDNMPEVVFYPVVDGKELNMVAESEDMAIILGLAYKYDGRNSQAAKMICRMLNIDSNWGA